MESPVLHAQARRVRVEAWQYPQSIDQPVVIESAVCDPNVVRIPQEVVHPIHPERIAANDLREKRLPRSECLARVDLRPDRQLGDVF